MADRSYDTGWLQIGPSKFEELAPDVAQRMNEQVMKEAHTVVKDAMQRVLRKSLDERLDDLTRDMVRWPEARLSEERNVTVGYRMRSANPSGMASGMMRPDNRVPDVWNLWGWNHLKEGGNMFVTDMQAAFGFNPRDVPDEGLKFVIAQLTGLSKDYETANIAVPERLTAKIAECWQVITDRAAAEKKRRLNELNREYDRLYEQTHPKRKLEDIDNERKAILAELETKS